MLRHSRGAICDIDIDAGDGLGAGAVVIPLGGIRFHPRIAAVPQEMVRRSAVP